MRAWRPIGLLAPVALVPGCVTTRAVFTPAVSVGAWAEEVPPATMRELPGPASLVERWQLPQGSPWAPWAKMTLLAALPGADLVPGGVLPFPAPDGRDAPLLAPSDAPPPDPRRLVDDGLSGALPPYPPPAPVPPPPAPVPPPSSIRCPLPDVSKLAVVARAECAARRLARQGLPAGTMLVVDVRGAGSVAFGATLSQEARDPVAAIPTFNNWPAENEIVPAEETLAALATMQPRYPQPADGAALPVFLLDAWRLADPDLVPDEDATDNRYLLTSADLPDAATLAAHGIRRVVYVVESLDDTDVEMDDLHAPFRAFQEAGIELSMVDLGDLCGLDHPTLELLVERRYRVGERATVVDDPGFFARARGGFGGVHAGPCPFRPGVLFHGGGGG